RSPPGRLPTAHCASRPEQPAGSAPRNSDGSSGRPPRRQRTSVGGLCATASASQARPPRPPRRSGRTEVSGRSQSLRAPRGIRAVRGEYSFCVLDVPFAAFRGVLTAPFDRRTWLATSYAVFGTSAPSTATTVPTPAQPVAAE